MPTEIPLLDEEAAGLSGPPLQEHVAKVKEYMGLAEQLLCAARQQVLEASRERFNQHQVEIVFEPGELVALPAAKFHVGVLRTFLRAQGPSFSK